MAKIIDIADDNDDISVIYSTPKAPKGKAKNFIEVEKNYSLFSKPSSSGTKKVMNDLSEEYPDDEIQFLGTQFVQNSKGCSNIKPVFIGYDNDNEISTSEIEFLGNQFVQNSKGCSSFKPVFIMEDNDKKNSTSEIEYLGTKFVRNSKGGSNFKSIYISDDDDHKEVDDKFTCDICVDEKSVNDIFKIMGCSHSYCKECMAKYVGTKLQENVCHISCPVLGCNGVLEPYNCRPILPKHVFDRWGDVLCEAMILGSERFYCPFKDCSALLTIDESCRNVVVMQSECPECRRLFCAECKVGWHSGIVCEEFQKLNKDEREKEDLQLMQLAKGQEWQRCPRCRIYVARSDGCAQMRCRCGCDFCYKCGAESTNHHCKRCGTLNGL